MALFVTLTAVRADDAALGLPLAAVRFVCDAWFDEAAVRQELPLHRGEPVTAAQLAETRAVLERVDIFRDIEIDPLVEQGEAVVLIRLKRRQVLTGFRVRGYRALNWRTVFRSLRLRTGTFYDSEQLEAARQRLIERYDQSGYPAAEVSARVRKRAGEVELDIAIREGEPQRVRVVAVTGDTGVPDREL
ncbi:MAG: POTRA domain-containing protein [Candidatus Binatia bacterium]